MRDQDPERPSAPVTRGRFGEPRPGRTGDTNGHGYRHAPGHNGHPTSQPVGRPFAEADDDGPVDLVELQADDELINALSSGGLGVTGPGRLGYDVDDRLVAMLSSWKGEVDRDPVPDLVDPDEAVQMLQPARPSRRVGFLRPLVAAAAVAACAVAVVSVGAQDAEPGDALWGISRVLYSERAEQVQAAADLRTGIERVNAKLAAGDTGGAEQDLAALGALVGKVGPDQQSYFEEQNRFLSAKVAETPPGTPTDPSAPLRDGTPAPRPPATEGGGDQQDQVPPPVPAPSSTSETPSGSTDPGTSGPGNPRPEGGIGNTGTSGPNDPRVLEDPGTPDPSDSSTSPSTSQTPTTEGSVDPTTPSSTSTRPTAAGEGGADATRQSASPSTSTSPSSSTTSGAVSSSPN
ncbi:anti-sigma-D factor RsdA [Pseudonocardia nematodicida]|uniref:Anti-sigma-D factor RsdA n=1 Tax=Pseudonocardia nematodicida TaxID=1206997 RepID=A0ABV1K804_9PSEU